MIMERWCLCTKVDSRNRQMRMKDMVSTDGVIGVGRYGHCHSDGQGAGPLR